MVRSVKDGFLRNLRLYYDKKEKNGSVTPGIIRPVKHLLCKLSGETKKVTDTWQFIDHEGLTTFIKNKEIFRSYSSSVLYSLFLYKYMNSHA